MSRTATSEPAGSSAPPARVTTRASRGIHQPKEHKDGTVRWCFSSVVSDEPANLKDAMANTHWENAMDEEYGVLVKNHTWRLVPPQHSKNIIDCHRIYKVKK